ncbi:MAG: ABC transporter ATP-binding protein [Oscillospiraceae bacterium]
MVEIQKISYAYHRDSGDVLTDVSFDVNQGQCVAILGNNGAGKSTLLKCIDRIYPAREGTVVVSGQNIFQMSGGELAQNVAYVPQNVEPANMTVFDVVLLGRKPYIKWDATAEDRAIVSELLHSLSLEPLALRRMSELSGGEAQKVTLARALAQEPKFLLLDEPTSNLDLYNQHEVLRTVRAIAREHGISVALIIHDLNLAIRYCDRFLFLKNARVFSYGGLETVTPETIEQVYQIHVHIMEYMGLSVIIPFPDEVVSEPE